jgi:hypothetical protein
MSGQKQEALREERKDLAAAAVAGVGDVNCARVRS